MLERREHQDFVCLREKKHARRGESLAAADADARELKQADAHQEKQ